MRLGIGVHLQERSDRQPSALGECGSAPEFVSEYYVCMY